MAAKPWKCRMPGCGAINDPNSQFREVGPNTCADCHRWRYLLHAIGFGGLSILVIIAVIVGWLLGMPERTYREKYAQYLQDDKELDEEEKRELGRLAEKYKIPPDVVKRIEREFSDELKIEITIPSHVKSELIAMLHNIYSDNMKTEADQAYLDDAIKKYRIDQEASNRLEQQIKSHWEKSRPYFERGFRFIKEAKYQAAIDELQRARDEDDDNAWILANLGAAYIEVGRLGDALSACQKALEVDPKCWLARYNLGSLYAVRGERDLAISELSNALRLLEEDKLQRFSKSEIIAQMKTDRTLASIRKDPRFRQLLSQE